MNYQEPTLLPSHVVAIQPQQLTAFLGYLDSRHLKMAPLPANHQAAWRNAMFHTYLPYLPAMAGDTVVWRTTSSSPWRYATVVSQ